MQTKNPGGEGNTPPRLSLEAMEKPWEVFQVTL
jgi:hypothetical protein